tara:strand:+ start:15738 stop:16721 length:984 start_codon:yes stop_codon:yes gene_type:complete
MSIADDYIQRQILTQRYIARLTKENLSQLVQMHEMIGNMIVKSGSTIKLEAMRRDIEFALGESIKKFDESMKDSLTKLAQQELLFISNTVTTNTNILLAAVKFETIKEAIMNSSLGIELGGMTLGQALQEFELGQATAIRQIIFDGVVTGESLRDMAKNVRNLGATRTKAQIDTLTRTLVNHTTAQTRLSFALERKGVFSGEEWIAVLDSRTTMLCAGRDGTVYDVGMGPQPPAHWNCRSLRVPVINSQYDEQTGKSNREDFDTWLRDQPKGFQEEFFAGKSNQKDKLALFRKGDLKLEKFRDESGVEYSMDELQSYYADAYKKSGI